MKQLLLWPATFFGVGYIPIAPGTWASLITAATLYAATGWGLPLPYYLAALGLVIILGIPAAKAAETHFEKKDPRYCVIDEVAGQMTALLLTPHRPGYYIAAFFLFRFFDIVKPFPVRQSERLPGGIGIMTDDILAGGYSWLILYLFQIIRH